jgi:hypothetical protein
LLSLYLSTPVNQRGKVKTTMETQEARETLGTVPTRAKTG